MFHFPRGLWIPLFIIFTFLFIRFANFNGRRFEDDLETRKELEFKAKFKKIVDEYDLNNSPRMQNPFIVPSDEVPENFSDMLVFPNYIKSEMDFVGNESVTWSSQSTYELFHHIPLVCDRWKGPMSMVVYAPGDDLQTSIDLIVDLRQCSSQYSACIREYVTWHIMYPRHYGPETLPPFPYSSERCANVSKINEESFRSKYDVLYPINIARNVAIHASRTFYYAAVDNELYPSSNIIQNFLTMYKNTTKAVYLLPTFELYPGNDVPNSKSELKILFQKGYAILFRYLVCAACFQFPHVYEWIDLPSNPDTEFYPFFSYIKKAKSYPLEPFYIGDKTAPLYYTKLSWDGTMDKFTQVMEMSYRKLDFIVMNEPFLCHYPGLQTRPYQFNPKRKKHVEYNAVIYNKEINRLKEKYEKIMLVKSRQ